MLYQGSCHCGRIRFEIEGTIAGAATYTFNKHRIKHRCVEGIDLAAIPTQQFNGRAL